MTQTTRSPSNPRPMAVTGLSKSYGTVHVLDDINVTVAPGEFLCIVGPSGVSVMMSSMVPFPISAWSFRITAAL
jgi:ABC-type transporter Mla maintaining outer membrane lipid asymmetry ATPase subunit MlaF